MTKFGICADFSQKVLWKFYENFVRTVLEGCLLLGENFKADNVVLVSRFNHIAFLHDCNNYPQDYINNSPGVWKKLEKFSTSTFTILQSHPLITFNQLFPFSPSNSRHFQHKDHRSFEAICKYTRELHSLASFTFNNILRIYLRVSHIDVCWYN